MAALLMGTMAYVSYVGDGDLFHERLAVGWVEVSEYVVLTPDFDWYIEQLDAGNGELSGLRVGDTSGAVPLGLTGEDVYSFQVRPSGAALDALAVDARAAARRFLPRSAPRSPAAGARGGRRIVLR